MCLLCVASKMLLLGMISSSLNCLRFMQKRLGLSELFVQIWSIIMNNFNQQSRCLWNSLMKIGANYCKKKMMSCYDKFPSFCDFYMANRLGLERAFQFRKQTRNHFIQYKQIIVIQCKRKKTVQLRFTSSHNSLQSQATINNYRKIYSPLKIAYKCERVFFDGIQPNELIIDDIIFSFLRPQAQMEGEWELIQGWQNQQGLKDLFVEMLNEEETPQTEELSSKCQGCDDQSIDQDTNKVRVDAFSEPAYINIQKAKPALPISIVKTTEKFAEFYRSPIIPRQQTKTCEKVAKLQIQTTDSKKTPTLAQDILQNEEQMRKYLKKQKEKEGKKESYPTKNFLPSFRSSFLNYIKPHFTDNQFYSFQIIKRIKGKPCINLKDYQDLFKPREFRHILAVYFENQVIVRDLMMSRIDYEVKMEYMKRIHVFEQAFESGVFKKIN